MPIQITDEELSKLKQLALDARTSSYSPYSKFRVGAAILTSDGAYVQGANVESCSFGATVCAERSAGVKAVTEGHKQFKAIAVSSDQDSPVSPCGICRQFIREFSPLTMPVYMFSANGDDYKRLSLEELLPLSFGPESLGE